MYACFVIYFSVLVLFFPGEINRLDSGGRGGGCDDEGISKYITFVQMGKASRDMKVK